MAECVKCCAREGIVVTLLPMTTDEHRTTSMLNTMFSIYGKISMIKPPCTFSPYATCDAAHTALANFQTKR